MKSRTLTLALMIGSLFVAAASGQDQAASRAQAPTPIGQLVLQDDNSGDYIVVDLSTGSYKFKSCASDFVLGGIGHAGISGCNVSLKDVSESRMVLVQADRCGANGRAFIEIQYGGTASATSALTREFTINDSNTRNSTPVCGTFAK